MPVWLVCTSMFSASGCSSITLACQATTPSLRLKIEVLGTGSGSTRRRVCSGDGAVNRSPVMLRQLETTFVAAGTAKRLPSVTTMRTERGAMRVASRAMMPPQLRPTRLTCVPLASLSARTRAATAGRSDPAGRLLRPRFQPIA